MKNVFSPLLPPPYKPAVAGAFTLAPSPFHKEGEESPVPMLGYFGPSEAAHQNWVLREGKRIWMSLTMMELESQGYQSNLAKGEVVVAGLGMGVLTWNLLKNPKVTRVTVLEKSPDVIKLIGDALPELWFSSHLEVINVDAKEWKAEDRKVDLLIADIWPDLGASEAVDDVIQMLSNVKARRVAWWGQEFDIVSELMERKMDVREAASGLEFLEEQVGAKIVGRSVSVYPALAVQAVTFQTLANMRRAKR